MASRRIARNWMALWSTMSLVTGLGILVVWYFGGSEVLRDELSIGTLLAIYSYMCLIYGPMEWFAEVNSWMTRAFAGAERIFEIIDAPPEAYEDPDAVAMPAMQGKVHFDGVSFGYDKSKPVLQEIDLEVAPGEMIGLVGRASTSLSPAGKVFIRGEYWTVEAREFIDEGEAVEVVAVEGLTLRVKKATDPR